MTSLFHEQQLSRLLYTSHIPGSVEEGEVAELLAHIKERSMVRNQRCGITGCLVVVDRCFIQILEGERKTLEDTFERICCDFRHVDVHLADFITIEQRAFAEWGLACLCDNEETSLEIKNGLEELHFIVGINARQATRLMRQLIDQKNILQPSLCG